MLKIVEIARFPYTDRYGLLARCRLRVWAEKGQAPVAIASDLTGELYGSACVTETAELLWRLVSDCLSQSEGLVMIEHHFQPVDRLPREIVETFDLVTFKGPGPFEEPLRNRLHRAEVEAILDGNDL